jgi:hypothetical protein
MWPRASRKAANAPRLTRQIPAIDHRLTGSDVAGDDGSHLGDEFERGRVGLHVLGLRSR